MVKYVCKSCGFKTEVKSSVPNKCPYCGDKRGFRREENAEELLEEDN